MMNYEIHQARFSLFLPEGTLDTFWKRFAVPDWNHRHAMAMCSI